MRSVRFLLPALLPLLLTACNDNGGNKAETKPIVLGDSSTIVTETDPTLLVDIVPDLNIPEAGSYTGDTALTAPPVKDTTTVQAPVEQPKPTTPDVAQPAAAGYTVDFGEVKVTLVGANIRDAGKKFSGSNSASLVTNGGEFTGKSIQVSGGTVSKVQQRSQMVVVATKGNDALQLTDLGTSTTSWQQLKGSGATYAIAPASGGTFKNGNQAGIRNAVQRAAQKRRLSRSAQQEWINSVKSVRTVGQGGVQPTLRAITWRIDGKDSKGKSFSKEVRVDVAI